MRLLARDRLEESIFPPASFALLPLDGAFEVGKRGRFDVLHKADYRAGFRVDIQLRLAAGAGYSNERRVFRHVLSVY